MGTVQSLRKAENPRPLRSINPANGQILAEYASLKQEEIEQKLRLAAESFLQYRRTSFSERAAIVTRAAELLENEKDRFGELMSREMGKLRQAGIDEALKCARNCRFYVENAEKFLSDQPASSPSGRRYIAFQPLGPILAVMPWNFPFWQVFRFAAPALMAGNTILLKHASNVPQCALAIQEIWRTAGLPEGVFQTLMIGSHEVDPIIRDNRIRAVTLTGSDTAGAKVAAAAGQSLKKVVLELGGSDPFIVMPSVDIDYAAQMAIAGRTINNGESCVAAKRFIIHESIADAFEEKFVEGMKSLRVGDPLDPRTQLGPLAKEEIREILASQVERSVRAGAQILTGGQKIPGQGFYFQPTVLTSISPQSPAYHEEFFGPVALLFRARNIDDAIAIANDNPFGLGSSLWSADPAEQETFVRDIDAGMAFINSQVASDPPIPFGGVKRSGYGRELSEFGIREFVNIKTVSILPAHSPSVHTGTE